MVAIGENHLSEEEIHFIQTCCHILQGSDGGKVNHIAMTAMVEGEGGLGLTIITI
jgi:hypothetical protein